MKASLSQKGSRRLFYAIWKELYHEKQQHNSKDSGICGGVSGAGADASVFDGTDTADRLNAFPMHIPVLLCGFVCGWPWGLAVGVVAPPLRSVLFGMPPMYPTALCMAFELAAYGAVAGLMYRALSKKKSNIYVALITAMIAGRLVWGAARFLCTGLDPSKFGFAAFWAGRSRRRYPA